MSWPNRATADPRRDGILLWLADYGAPPIAESASTLARMVGAARRVGAQDQVLLDVARDALTQPITEPGLVGNVIAGRSDDAVLEPLRMFAAAIDQLRVDAGLTQDRDRRRAGERPAVRTERRGPPRGLIPPRPRRRNAGVASGPPCVAEI